jgi:hypothetical protein
MAETIWTVVKNIAIVAFWFVLVLVGQGLAMVYEWWRGRQETN